MRRHVFRSLPRWSIGLKPGLIWVRCPGWKGHTCGRPHKEYFGPRDHSELAAEIELLRHELERAAAIIAYRPLAAPRKPPGARAKPQARR